MDYTQISFLGGLNYQVDSSKRGANEYHLLVNARTRKDAIEPIYAPLNLSNRIPSGKLQGLYAAGSYLLVFVSGQAWWTNTDMSSDYRFTRIRGFQMSAEVDTIWAEAIPASTINKGRIATSPANVSYTNTTINGSVACIVCQDGVNQPYLIFSNGEARVAATYEEWEEFGNREYIPIGKQMLYHDGKLYIVSQDSKEIYQSVSGRPADFMVVVGSEETGGQLKLPKGEGGQVGVTHKVDYNEITAIRAIPSSAEGGFLVATRYATYLVQPDYTDTYFGEPSFSNLYLFSAGLNNQNCIVEVHGDTLFIDQDGINSFNNTKQLRYASNNDTISGKIFALFADTTNYKLTQFGGAAIVYDDCAYFAMQTILGPAIIVYDMVTKVFSGLDIYEGITSGVKQFAEVRGITGRKLFFITSSGLYQAFGDKSKVETVTYIAGEWCSNDPNIEQKVKKVKAIFNDAKTSGTITATLFCDKVSTEQIAKTIEANSVDVTGFMFGSSKDTSKVVTFDLSNDAQACWKIAIMLQWNFNGILTFVGADVETITLQNSYEMAAKEYDNIRRNNSNP